MHKIRKIKNKKGLSEVVSYVLLIVVAVSLAVIVYGWLKVQLPKEKPLCPDNIGIAIKSYNCNLVQKTVNITIENRGYFNIEGVNVKIANTSGGVAALPVTAISGAIAVNNEGFIYFNRALNPREEYFASYNYSIHNQIKKIQIIPFIFDKKTGSSQNQIILCTDNILSQEIQC
jgi:flagellin-like protein